MKIGIVLICTNSYFILALRFIKNFVKYYTDNIKEITFYVFSDTDPTEYMPNIKNFKYFNQSTTTWVDGTNSKYKNIVSLSNEPVDYLFYVDSDTDINKPFGKMSFIGDVVGGEHYNNISEMNKPYDRNPLSMAYIPKDTLLPQIYYYGCFFGGKKDTIVEISKLLLDHQRIDREIPYEPVFNDESYLNKYFHVNRPTRIIPTREFMFVVSDKGGLGDTRNMSLDISKYKDLVLKNPHAPFKLTDGVLTFYQEGGKRRSIKKTKKRKSK